MLNWGVCVCLWGEGKVERFLRSKSRKAKSESVSTFTHRVQ